jgi:hypothetical protein
MATIWNDRDRADVVTRMWALTPAHAAKWGKFSVGGMLAHLNDATRMATGDLDVDGKAPAILKWAPVRYLVIHKLPMPKSAPTAPGLLTRTATADLSQEQQAFVTLMDALARCQTLAPTHPAFGRMTRDDWGALIHKHVDHHLKQFGV